MSDAVLRDLERRWRQTRSVDDEAAYLLRRVRAGELCQQRLELAAYCGHPAFAPAAAVGPDVAEAFLVGLAPWGREACVRAGVAAFRAAFEPDGASKPAERCLAALSDWVGCPCDAHVRAVQAAHADLRGSGVEVAAAACLVWSVVSEQPQRSAWTASLALRPLTTMALDADLLSAMRAELSRWALSDLA